MTGIRKRVTIGFLSIVALLFFSGLVSLFELSHMSVDIEAILGSSRRSIEMSKNMLSAIHANDRAVVNYAVLRDSIYADSCRSSIQRFNLTIRQARSESGKSSADPLFDSLSLCSEQMEHAIEKLLDRQPSATFDGRKWYDDNYLPLYNSITDGIIDVMSSAQGSLTPRAEQLNRNAYRSVTPVFISLLVMIAILLMFYYFIMIYTVKPIIEMNRSLGDWLRYKLPFDVKAECRDEMQELKEKIESVMVGTKTTK